MDISNNTELNKNEILCGFCEKLYPEEITYNVSANDHKKEIMCIDCLYETYYHLELS